MPSGGGGGGVSNPTAPFPPKKEKRKKEKKKAWSFQLSFTLNIHLIKSEIIQAFSSNTDDLKVDLSDRKSN